MPWNFGQVAWSLWPRFSCLWNRVLCISLLSLDHSTMYIPVVRMKSKACAGLLGRAWLTSRTQQAFLQCSAPALFPVYQNSLSISWGSVELAFGWLVEDGLNLPVDLESCIVGDDLYISPCPLFPFTEPPHLKERRGGRRNVFPDNPAARKRVFRRVDYFVGKRTALVYLLCLLHEEWRRSVSHIVFPTSSPTFLAGLS